MDPLARTCECPDHLNTLVSHIFSAVTTLYHSAAVAILLVLLITLDLHTYVLQAVFCMALFMLGVFLYALLALITLISLWEDARIAARVIERRYGDSPVRILLDREVRSGIRVEGGIEAGRAGLEVKGMLLEGGM